MSVSPLKLSLPDPKTDWCFDRQLTVVTENSFRVLGIPANATKTAIDKAYESQRRRLKLGSVMNLETDLEWLGKVGRSENKLRDALGRLASPSLRIRDRIFWFDEPPVISDRLLPADVGELIKKGLSADGPQHKHSASLLALAACYSFDSHFNEPKLWSGALSLWHELFSGAEFRKYILNTELDGGFDKTATPKEIKSFCGETVRLILPQIAGQVSRLLEKNLLKDAERGLNTVRFSKLTTVDIRFFENEALGQFEEKYAEICTDEFDGQLLRPNAVKIRILPYLKALCLLGGPESDVTRRVMILSAEYFLGFARDYLIVRDRENTVFRDFLRSAWILAPPDSYISEQIREFTEETGLWPPVPLLEDLRLHYQRMIDDLGTTVASLVPVEYNFVEDIRFNVTDTTEPVESSGQTGLGCLVAIVLFALIIICKFADPGNKSRTTGLYNYKPPPTVRNINKMPVLPSSLVDMKTVPQLKEMMRLDSVIVVDARGLKSFEKGKIPGAIFYESKNTGRIVVDARRTGKAVVVYGQGFPDQTTREAASRIRLEGASEVSVLSSGYSGWRSADKQEYD